MTNTSKPEWLRKMEDAASSVLAQTFKELQIPVCDECGLPADWMSFGQPKCTHHYKPIEKGDENAN